MSQEPDFATADDKALVKAAQKGGMQAFEELVARHRDKIYGRAFSMMRNEEEAVDLSQEAWVKAWQRDRKSTRLNSSHVKISYAVFCLKKKKKERNRKTSTEMSTEC